jgi:hypothetical protein
LGEGSGEPPKKRKGSLTTNWRYKMSATNKTIKSVRFIEKSNSLLLKTESGETFFLNVNLTLHELEIPYTKKNGQEISKNEILAMKAISKERYVQKIKENKLNNQKASA